MIGWHFLTSDRKLRYGDGRTVTVGQVFTQEYPHGEYDAPTLCSSGMHASSRALDALGYAPGVIICKVDISGGIVHGHDKSVAESRRVLAMADAGGALHEFACWCAEQALLRERAAGREPDRRSWNAIEAKRKWSRGEVTDEELAAAYAAAADAAYAAGAAADAAYAAYAAAYAAAADAAGARAAYAVAADAAYAAAYAAGARAAYAGAARAAGAAARAVQNDKLEEMLNALLGTE